MTLLLFAAAQLQVQRHIRRHKLHVTQTHRGLLREAREHGLCMRMRAMIGADDVRVTDGRGFRFAGGHVLAAQFLPETLAFDAAPNRAQFRRVRRQQFRCRGDAAVDQSLQHFFADADKMIELERHQCMR